MDKTTAAYIAGVMDGEGCFRLERFATKHSLIGFQYRSIAEVMMCDRATIEFIAKATNRATIAERLLPSGRTAYGVTWRNSIAAGLIRAILPYLRGKKDQAELCLYFEEHVTPGRGRTYKAGDKERCDAIRERLSAMKRP